MALKTELMINEKLLNENLSFLLLVNRALTTPIKVDRLQQVCSTLFGLPFISIFWSENKVLVTTEEFLPVIEVAEHFPGQHRADLKWLMEVATTWEDVKSLRQDMERAGSVSYLSFRSKLLQAAANMQVRGRKW